MSDEQQYECPHNPRCTAENNGPCWQQFKAGLAMMGGMMANFGTGMALASAGHQDAGMNMMMGAANPAGLNVTVSSSSTQNGYPVASTTVSGPAVSMSVNAQPALNAMGAAAMGAAAGLANAMANAAPHVSVSLSTPQVSVSTPNVSVSLPSVNVAPVMGAAVNAAAGFANALVGAFSGAPAPAPPPPPTVQILVNGYSMSPDGGFVIYDVEVHCQFNGGAASIVAPTKRRFSALSNMHESIQEELGIPLPEFPPKKIFNMHLTNPPEVEQRLQRLRSYFDQVSKIPAYLGSNAFLPGLALDTHPQLASVLTYFKQFVVPKQVALPYGQPSFGGMGQKASCHDTRCKHFMEDVVLPHTHDISCSTPACPNFMKHGCPQHSFTVIQTDDQ